MKADLSEPRYSIAAVSKLTGVSCHTLRVWERRYGFPEPLRTPAGHRRYAADQVNLICEVARRARSKGMISELIAEIRKEGASQPTSPEGLPPDPALSELLEALVRADLDAAESCYAHAVNGRTVAEVANQIITPALTEAGEQLFRRDCALFQERLASMFLLRKLAALVEQAQQANVHPLGQVISVVLQGDRHEGGALMLSLALELAGWRAVFLGSDLSVQEIQKAIQTWHPFAVGVSFTLSRNVRKRFNELNGINGAPVFIGGRSVVNYQGLAQRCGLSVLLGPAIPNVANYLIELSNPSPSPSDGHPALSIGGSHPTMASPPTISRSRSPLDRNASSSSTHK